MCEMKKKKNTIKINCDTLMTMKGYGVQRQFQKYFQMNVAYVHVHV